VEDLKKIVKPLLGVLFALYSCVLVYVLFFSRTAVSDYPILEYLKSFSNFVPLKTIMNYAKLSTKGFVTLAWTNIFGNFVLFLPMGMLLPCLLKRVDRFWKVILINLAMILGVEALQCVFRVGVVDIDDVILNISGAMAGYGIISIPVFDRAICRVGIRVKRGAKEDERSRKE